ncbi:glycosyltransferase family 4 protein [Aestuariibacter salexigens]|uniref:glycosyltransferase family 4 protein n=1 Tax=Aestuariibacter salexigens TaxID=226010 RepID=UPI00047D43C0|nr:glycosyltransferase family 4 protein [Aestuariibacter salexigens]
MRVLYFHQHFSTPGGATGTRSYEMAKKLIQRGHSVTMVCGSYNVAATGLTSKFENGRREGSVDGIHVIEFDLTYANADSFLKRTWQFIKYALRSTGIALTHDYDVVFATSTPLTASIPGILARWLRGKRFVFEVRDLWPELPKAMGVITNPVVLMAMSVLEKISYVSAHACIGLSPGIVEGIKRRCSKDKPVYMIPNGCDLSLYDENPKNLTLPKSINTGDVLVVFTGAHGMANGLDKVLDAAQELEKRGEQRVTLLFVGEGKLKPALKARAEQQDLSNCIFMDAIPKTKLMSLMYQADAGLMSLANVPAFYYGTSPNKFFDYISAGLPVINNYPGWLAEMITENDCGKAVPPDNATALADALQALADNPEQLKDMGIKARALAEKQFDRSQLSDHFVQALEQVGTA